MSTSERLLLNKYSQLLEKATLENQVLREELVKAKRESKMFYENKCRWQYKCEDLEKEIKRIKECVAGLNS